MIPFEAGELVLPVFVREGRSEPTPIRSMPGVVQHSMDSLRAATAEAAGLGIGGVMIFGIPELRDAQGSQATNPDGILSVATRTVIAEVGSALVVQADLCLDEFTDHGHCGLLSRDGSIDLPATLERYRDMGLVLAEAGAHMLGLSGMMRGQVAAVRLALEARGSLKPLLLAYSAKYASAMYEPFRDAVESAYAGGPRDYQLDPADRAAGVERAMTDVSEGADVVMVKPAGGYLDVVAEIAVALRSHPRPIPVWAYQVSGEYAAIEAAAAVGSIDRRRAVLESLAGIRRAGASGVLSYWATDVARWFAEENGT